MSGQDRSKDRSFAVRASLIAYRWLLYAYPREFRARFGTAMTEDGEALLQDSRGLVRAWLLLLRDFAVSVPREWWRARAADDATRLTFTRYSRPPSYGQSPLHWSVDGMTQDLRFALRMLRRSPGFSAVLVLVLGLGIGATTVMFSALNTVVLKPLPYPDPDRLVRLYEVTPHGDDFSTSEPNLVDFRERNRTLVDLAAYVGGSLNIMVGGEPERLTAVRASAELFSLTGGKPLLGRTFLEEEDRPGGRTRVALLSQGLWRRRFDADPGIVGQTLVLSGVPYEVVGVMPAMYRSPGASPGEVDLWVPLAADPTESRGDHRLRAIGRLKPGVTLEQAQADLQRVAADLSAAYPQSNEGWGARSETVSDWLIGPTLRRRMFVLFGAVGLLLLLTCANVSNLLVVRATARQREMGVRVALGGGRVRIAQQLLTESVVLAALGGGASLGIAYSGVALLRWLSPQGVPRVEEVAMDGGALLFTVFVTLATGVLFGLVPVVHTLRRSLHDVLREGGRVDTWRGRRVRNGLVIGEIALATMLLVGAGLLVESFRRLQAIDVGYDAQNVLNVPVMLVGARYAGCDENTERSGCTESPAAARIAFLRDAIEGLEALPGVVAAGATNIAPLGGGNTGQEVAVEGRPVQGPEDELFANWRTVTSGFFDAGGIPIVRGRNFTAAEEFRFDPVMVISETAARTFWPNEDAVGKRFSSWGDNEGPFTVVGVARDIRDTGLEAEPIPTVYLPFGGWWAGMRLLVKAHGDPAMLAPAIRQAIWDIDPTLPLPEVRPLASYRADAVAGERFAMRLMAGFALLALVLATLGVYGVTMFAVSRRMREIGLRMALGAERISVMGMIVKQGLVLVGSGVVLGALGAFALSRFVQALLFETPTVDLRVYAAVALVLTTTSVLSSLLPARRAARVDPRVALAAE